MSFDFEDSQEISDSASSVYSRLPGSPGPLMTLEARLALIQEQPEINSLDHQIAMSRGSSIALETLRSRLRRSKQEIELSPARLRDARLRQWEQQQYENEFYASCRRNFNELSTVVLDVTKETTLQCDFEPDVDPVGNIQLLRAILSLRGALETSRKQEAEAEQVWKCQWKTSRIWSSSDSWI